MSGRSRLERRKSLVMTKITSRVARGGLKIVQPLVSVRTIFCWCLRQVLLHPMCCHPCSSPVKATRNSVVLPPTNMRKSRTSRKRLVRKAGTEIVQQARARVSIPVGQTRALLLNLAGRDDQSGAIKEHCVQRYDFWIPYLG